LPADATIVAPDNTGCLGGFAVVYRIFGGTPPYSASASVPNAVTLQNSVNIPFGGAFTAITTGLCVNPVTFTIVDATGAVTTATLHNLLGANPPAPPPATGVEITPGSYKVSGAGSCTGKTFSFIVDGGLPPYNAAVIGGTVAPSSNLNASPGNLDIINLTDGSGNHTIKVGDASTPQLTANASVLCN
jgi:hypothetical protein